MPPEAKVTINGVPLTEGQVLTLRVAIGAFIMSMAEDAEWEHVLGELGPLYLQASTDILKLMRGTPA